MNAHKISSYKDYHSVLENDPEEYKKLFSTITIKVSEFFREPEVFDLLKEQLTACPVSPDEGIRAWSCGCAHGEEAYSLGMILLESFDARGTDNVRIFATDVDEGAIEIARKGVYSCESLKKVSDQARDKFFIKSDGNYKVRYSIRDMVSFGRLDIVNSTPISGIDILLCRNLLIYFEKELQRRVLDKLDFALNPGGLLVLGKSEGLPSHLASRYKEVGERSRVYRKAS